MFRDSGRRIEGEIVVPGVTVQVFREDYPTPVETVIRESDLTVALQRQPPQFYSSGRYCISGARESFGAIGRVLVVPAEAPLQVRASGGAVRAVRCSFARDRLERHIGRTGPIEPGELESCLDVRDRSIAGTLARMGQEAFLPGFGSEILTEALGISLMVEFQRYLRRTRSPSRPSRGGLTQRQLKRVAEMVEERRAPPTLEELADATGISRRHLTRAFKESTGQTIHGYVEQARLDRAMRLLGDSDLMMKEIAHRLGFASSSGFSVAFRRAAGETPLAYRKRLRSGL
jgi:AraC family transcriptional regulator